MKIEIITIYEIDCDITFYIGQNKNDNFSVIDKGSSTDLWFHAKTESSCHVVALIPEDIERNELKYIIKKGAALCKTYTNKLKDLHNVEIIYSQLKNVKKTRIPGLVNVLNEKKIVI
jgi:predicted ribosome quality control (RQC) complex YloA/Tae2 family protein